MSPASVHMFDVRITQALTTISNSISMDKFFFPRVATLVAMRHFRSLKNTYYDFLHHHLSQTNVFPYQMNLLWKH